MNENVNIDEECFDKLQKTLIEIKFTPTYPTNSILFDEQFMTSQVRDLKLRAQMIGGILVFESMARINEGNDVND